MSPQPPSSIYGPVEAVAVQYGVPIAIWEDVAYAESGYNPKAIGDQGTSFGLFQLHIGGQLPSQYDSNPTPVFDPGLNARYAMPSIARAWNANKSSFDPNNLNWWERFAAESGHPGGSPGQKVTDNEAAILQRDYSGGSTPQPSANNPTITTDIPIISGLQQDIQNAILTPVESFIQSSFPRIGLFLLALILIIIGFVIMVK